MNNYCFILQARVGSTRLPKKMILPFFEGKTILEIIIEKLKFNFPNIPIILATSEKKENDILEKMAIKLKCHVFRGSEYDVLDRFIKAAETFSFNKIIRVCSDNPFLDIFELRRMINYINTSEIVYDYVSFNINNKPSITTHFGFWTEYVSLSALKNIKKLTNDPWYFEHVTNYIYTFPQEFVLSFIEANPSLNGQQDIRMTLDNSSDFEYLSLIYKELKIEYDVFGINEIIDFLAENNFYKKMMREQIELNSK